LRVGTNSFSIFIEVSSLGIGEDGFGLKSLLHKHNNLCNVTRFLLLKAMVACWMRNEYSKFFLFRGNVNKSRKESVSRWEHYEDCGFW
jgi:hypothetical protein